MRPIPLAKCEKEFIEQGFLANMRSDGRAIDDCRAVSIKFGHHYGRCTVSFGNTKVFACVSAALVTPKPNRPATGLLVVNLELSPMACGEYEGGRHESWIELQRLLEKNLKDSGCVDVESLCVIGGEKVWQIRCDIHVLDNDGSILDCSSFAAIAALRHFRRPFVSVKGLNFTIHDPKERSMVPITIYNSPFCVSCGIAKLDSLLIVSDLMDREELAISDIVVIAMNSYREITLVHTCKSSTLLDESELFRCEGRVISRVSYLTDLLNDTLKEDAELRSIEREISFAQLIQFDVVYASTEDKLFESKLTNGSDVILPPAPKVSANVETKKPTPVVEEVPEIIDVSSSSSDVEIIDEIMESNNQPNRSVEACAEKEKKRPVVPEDVRMLLDEIEEDFEVTDQPSTL